MEKTKLTIRQMMRSYALMYENWEFIDFIHMIIQPADGHSVRTIMEDDKCGLYKEVFKHFNKGLFTAWRYLNQREKEVFICRLKRYAKKEWDFRSKKFEVSRVIEIVNNIGSKIKYNGKDGQLWKQDPFRLWLSKDKDGQREIEDIIERYV